MLFKFQLSHEGKEAVKNIDCVKDEGINDHSTDDLRNFAWVARTSATRQG